MTELGIWACICALCRLWFVVYPCNVVSQGDFCLQLCRMGFKGKGCWVSRLFNNWGLC